MRPGWSCLTGDAMSSGQREGSLEAPIRHPLDWRSDDFYDDGYLGDPTGATAEEGKTLFESSVAGLCDAMVEVKAFDFGR